MTRCGDGARPPSRRLSEAATPLSDFLLAELAQRSHRLLAEGRAALVSAAKPLLAQLNAPVLAALLRRRLAAIAVCRKPSLPRCSRLAPGAASQRRHRVASARSAPSLLRDLIKCVLLEPGPRPPSRRCPGRSMPGRMAPHLAALIGFCLDNDAPLTTAGLMQHFAGGVHDAVLLAALTAGESEGLSRRITGNPAR